MANKTLCLSVCLSANCITIYSLSVQGIFTHWLDGSLLQNIDWNNQQLEHQWPNNILLLSENKLINVEYGNKQIKRILKLFDIHDQPVSDLNSNCTGVFTFFSCQARGWAAINCKQTLFTAFICLTHSKATLHRMVAQWRDGPSRNLTCPKGWLFIDFRYFKFIRHNHFKDASYINAHCTCQSEGGRLLSVRKIPHPKKVELQITEFARHMQSCSFEMGGFSHYTAEEWTIIISGVPFKYDSNPSEISHIFHLLKILSSMTTSKPLILPFFEISTETCWTLELGYLQYMTQQRSDDMRFKNQIF